MRSFTLAILAVFSLSLIMSSDALTKTHRPLIETKKRESDEVPIFSSKYVRKNHHPSKISFLHSNSDNSNNEKTVIAKESNSMQASKIQTNSHEIHPSIGPTENKHKINNTQKNNSYNPSPKLPDSSSKHEWVNMGVLQINTGDGSVAQNISMKPPSMTTVSPTAPHGNNKTLPHAMNNASEPGKSQNLTGFIKNNTTGSNIPFVNVSTIGVKNIINEILGNNSKAGNTTVDASKKINKCIKDEECGLHNLCDMESGQCYHKNLLHNISTYDIIGLFAHFFFSLVTVGVGSGVLFMSNLMIVLGFNFQSAAPISSVLTLVAHVSRNLFSFLDRHPEKDRPMINYDMATVFAPMMLLGTIFGVICNHSFPKWLIITMFALIFSVITYKTFMKGLDIFQKEHEKNLMGYSLDVSSVDSSDEEILNSFGSMHAGEVNKVIHGVSSDETKDQNVLNEDRDFSNFEMRKKENQAIKKSITKSSVNEARSDEEKDNELCTVKSARGRLTTIELGIVNTNLPVSLQGVQGGTLSEKGQINEPHRAIKANDSDEFEEKAAAPTEELVIYGEVESHTLADVHNEETNLKLQEFLNKEKRKVHWESLIFIFVIMMIVVAFSLLRGSKKFPSPIDVKSCDLLWWVLTFAFLPFAVIFTAYSIYQRNKEYDQKLGCNYEFSPADFKWNRGNIFKVITSGFFTGVIGSMFGIGGSVVCSPILIQLKLHPLEANYTASFMTLFTSIASALQYMLVEQISWDYTLTLSVLTFISTVLGLKYLLIWLSNNNKQSYIIFLLSFVILGSIVSIMYTGISDIINMAHNNANIWSFKSLC